MRRILSFDQANEILGPYILEYLECIRKGFSDYIAINTFKNSLEDYGDFQIRTSCGIVHDRIRARLTAKFGNKSKIEVGEWKQIFAIKFSEDLFLRIKKFSKDGTISNFKTTQHLRFLKQATLPGIPDEPTFIIGGYVPNPTWTDLIGIYLACYSADGLEWFNKVGEYVVEQGKIVFPEVPKETKKKRTKPKTKPNEDEKTGSTND